MSFLFPANTIPSIPSLVPFVTDTTASAHGLVTSQEPAKTRSGSYRICGDSLTAAAAARIAAPAHWGWGPQSEVNLTVPLSASSRWFSSRGAEPSRFLPLLFGSTVSECRFPQGPSVKCSQLRTIFVHAKNEPKFAREKRAKSRPANAEHMRVECLYQIHCSKAHVPRITDGALSTLKQLRSMLREITASSNHRLKS